LLGVFGGNAMLSFCALFVFLDCFRFLAAQSPDAYSREQLQPLTSFRQQHRRTIDGRLCAAAFVQDRVAYTGCTGAANPEGASGRDWCYVESQLFSVGSPAWNFCTPVMDYDMARVQAASSFDTKIVAIRAMVAKLQKTQRAAEKALDSYVSKCGSRQ
jgi:hypothetical protein